MSEGDARPQGNPDIDRLTHLPLYEGQRVKHELVYGVVKDRNTGEFHHDYASFRTLRKTKASPWKPDPRASFTLSDDKAGLLAAAVCFAAICLASAMMAARTRALELRLFLITLAIGTALVGAAVLMAAEAA